MSQQATAWALYHAPIELDAIEFRLLTIIADNVDNEGRGFGKSVKTLIELYRAPVSERTVRAKLAHMVELGVLREGDQRLVAYLPGNRRPKVYDIVMDKPETNHRGAGYAPQTMGETIADEPEPTPDGQWVEEDQSEPQGCNRPATGVQQGCNRGAAMVADKTIKNIKSTKNIERVRARETEKEQTFENPQEVAATPDTERLLAMTPDDTHIALAAETRQDVAYELAKYQDACLASGRIPKDPSAGFRNWLRRGRDLASHPTTPADTDPYDASADRILATSTILGSLLIDQSSRNNWKPALRQALAEGMTPTDAVNTIAQAIRMTDITGVAA